MTCTKFSDVTKAAKAVAALVLTESATKNLDRVLDPVWVADADKLKVYMPGSLLLLKSGEWALIPLRAAVTHNRAGELAVLVKAGSRPAEQKTETWFNDNVRSAWLGVLTDGAAGGAHSALAYNGLEARISAVIADPLAEAEISVSGCAPTKVGFLSAIDKLGLNEAERPWLGGPVADKIRPTGHLPAADVVAAATIGAQALVGGGSWALSRASRLAGVGMTIDPTGNPQTKLLHRLRRFID